MIRGKRWGFEAEHLVPASDHSASTSIKRLRAVAELPTAALKQAPARRRERTKRSQPAVETVQMMYQSRWNKNSLALFSAGLGSTTLIQTRLSYLGLGPANTEDRNAKQKPQQG